MEVGCEAIHFGQAENIGRVEFEDKSKNYASWFELLDKVRETALTVARRGTVICDAHMPAGGMVANGKLLFDFLSMFAPYYPVKEGHPYKVEMKKNYNDPYNVIGRTRGGVTPSGWSCDKSPYLLELDNGGPGDPISWFYNLPEDYRNELLEYTNDWLEKNDPNGFFEIPGSRVVTDCDINRYRANTNGEACPLGKNQEETIKRIWTE